MQALILLPYVTLTNELTVGGHTFWPFRKFADKYIKEPGARYNATRYLQIYKDHNWKPISDCVAVIVTVDEYHSLQNAILALKYLTLERHNNSPYMRLFDEHFFHDEAPLSSDDVRSFVLYDRVGTHAGVSPEQTGRFLPGSLRPEQLLNIDTDALSSLFRAIETQSRVKHAVSWYCKSVRWEYDRFDSILSLCIAFEVLTKIGTKREKKQELMERTRRLVLDRPYVSRWARYFYKKRNKITHSGHILASDLIYVDRLGHPVLPHDEIAQIVFHETMRTITHPAEPTSDLERAMRDIMKSDRVLGAIIANRSKLECVEAYLRIPSLNQKQAMTAMQLCSIVKSQDFSLTSERCAYFIELFMRKSLEDGDLGHPVLGSSIRQGLKNVVHILQTFKTNLDAGIYKLPASIT